MKLKKVLLPLLLIYTALVFIRRLFAAKSTIGKPSSSTSYDAIASYEAVDAYVEQEMRRLKIPGVSLAIVEDNQIVHLRGFGRARSGGEAPSPQTPFVLGSTTKSFTALAMMQLAEAGKIDLDAPVQRYLPWFRVADPEASAQMIVRHLLNQTSGLAMLPGMMPLADLDDSPDAAERQARALASLQLTRSVGSAFEYSNLNYNLLGLIIEAVSGESYADYIQHYIFNPLEMKHSYTSQIMAKQNGLAVGHRYWFAHPFAMPNLPLPRGSLASGQLVSSAENMAHYLIAHLNGGRYGDVQILSSTGIDELHRGVAEYRALGMTVGKYGMGWFFSDDGQTNTLWHGGNVPDFSSFMALLPEQKTGVVLLINADHYGLPPILAEVGLNVTALLAGQQPAPIKLGLIPWAMRALLLIPLLQIAGVIATLLLLRHWRQKPEHRPSGARVWGLHILLPLIPNLSLVMLPIFLQVKGMFRYLLLYMPDVAWITIICGGFAGIWSILRTGLIRRAVRKPAAH